MLRGSIKWKDKNKREREIWASKMAEKFSQVKRKTNHRRKFVEGWLLVGFRCFSPGDDQVSFILKFLTRVWRQEVT